MSEYSREIALYLRTVTNTSGFAKMDRGISAVTKQAQAMVKEFHDAGTIGGRSLDSVVQRIEDANKQLLELAQNSSNWIYEIENSQKELRELNGLLDLTRDAIENGAKFGLNEKDIESARQRYAELNDEIKEMEQRIRDAMDAHQDSHGAAKIAAEGVTQITGEYEQLQKAVKLQNQLKVDFGLDTFTQDVDGATIAVKGFNQTGASFWDELNEITQAIKISQMVLRQYQEELRDLGDETEDNAELHAYLRREIGEQETLIRTQIASFNDLNGQFTLLEPKLKDVTIDFDRLRSVLLDINVEDVEIEAFVRDLSAAGEAAAAAGTQFSVMEKEIELARAEFDRLNAATIRQKGELKSYIKSGKATAEGIAAKRLEINKAERAEFDHITTTRKLIGTHREQQQITGEVRDSYAALSVQLNRAETHIDTVANAEKEASRELEKLGLVADRVDAKLDGLIDSTNSVGDAVKSWETAFKTGAAVAVVDALKEGVQELKQRVVEFAKESADAFFDFDENARQALTLLDDKSPEMLDSIKNQALQLNTVLDRTSEETLPAVYQALSLQIPEQNLVDAITTSSRAARAGAAGLVETLVTGQSTVNAFVGSGYDLQFVYGQLFTLIDQGKVQMHEFGAEWADLANVAGEAETPIQDVMGGIALMTQQGQSSISAIEQMTMLLAQLSNDATNQAQEFKAAWGGSFRQFMAEGHSLADALELLETHANNTGRSFSEMFAGDSGLYRDQQAVQAALGLTGDKLAGLREETEVFYGDTTAKFEAAADIMDESAMRTKDGWVSAVDALKVAMGDVLTQSESFQDTATRLTATARRAAGVQGDFVDGLIENNVQAASSIEELADAFDILDDAGAFKGRVNDFDFRLNPERVDAVRQKVAELTGSWDEYIAVLRELEKIHNVDLTRAGELQNYEKMRAEIEEAAAAAASLQALIDAGKEMEVRPRIVSPNTIEGDLENVLRRVKVDEAVKRVGQGLTIPLQWDVGMLEMDTFGGKSIENAIQSVLDGDTIRLEVDGRVEDIRISGVDTTEIAKDMFGDDEPFSREAMAFAQNWVQAFEGELVLQTDGTRGKFGRLIGTLANGAGDTLSEALIREGWSLPAFTNEMPLKQVETFERLVNEAAEAGRGMFADKRVAAAYFAAMEKGLEFTNDDAVAVSKNLSIMAAEVGNVTEAEGKMIDQTLSLVDGLTDAQQASIKDAIAKNASIETIYGLIQAYGNLKPAQVDNFQAIVAAQLAIEGLNSSDADYMLRLQNLTAMIDFNTAALINNAIARAQINGSATSQQLHYDNIDADRAAAVEARQRAPVALPTTAPPPASGGGSRAAQVDEETAARLEAEAAIAAVREKLAEDTLQAEINTAQIRRDAESEIATERAAGEAEIDKLRADRVRDIAEIEAQAVADRAAAEADLAEARLEAIEAYNREQAEGVLAYAESIAAGNPPSLADYVENFLRAKAAAGDTAENVAEIAAAANEIDPDVGFSEEVAEAAARAQDVENAFDSLARAELDVDVEREALDALIEAVSTGGDVEAALAEYGVIVEDANEYAERMTREQAAAVVAIENQKVADIAAINQQFQLDKQAAEEATRIKIAEIYTQMRQDISSEYTAIVAAAMQAGIDQDAAWQIVRSAIENHARGPLANLASDIAALPDTVPIDVIVTYTQANSPPPGVESGQVSADAPPAAASDGTATQAYARGGYTLNKPHVANIAELGREFVVDHETLNEYEQAFGSGAFGRMQTQSPHEFLQSLPADYLPTNIAPVPVVVSGNGDRKAPVTIQETYFEENHYHDRAAVIVGRAVQSEKRRTRRGQRMKYGAKNNA